MNRKLLAIALAATIAATAGCKPDEAAEAAAAPPAPAAPVDAVTEVVDHGSPAGDVAGFDAKAFAGTYNGTIPCADCPGIDASIAFSPEGKYTQTLRYQERENSSVSEGNWTLDADGKRILLDPTSKDESDSWVEVVSPTEVRMLDGEGKPIDSGLNYSLKRS